MNLKISVLVRARKGWSGEYPFAGGWPWVAYQDDGRRFLLEASDFWRV